MGMPGIGRAGIVVAAALLVAGCATTFQPKPLATPDELHDVQSKVVGDVTVSVAILTDEHAAQHFGADFGKHNLQALWVSVRNGTDRRYWFIRNILDPDFYSAEEAALLLEGDVPRKAVDQLRQHLRDESIRAQLPPQTETEGFVYLPKAEGGRYVDIRLQGDAYLEDSARAARTADTGTLQEYVPRELRFGFALPLPDGDFDYERLDPTHTYAGQVLPDLRAEQLPTASATATRSTS